MSESTAADKCPYNPSVLHIGTDKPQEGLALDTAKTVAKYCCISLVQAMKRNKNYYQCITSNCQC